MKGAMAQAVKNLIELMPEHGMVEIMNNVGTLGWENCPWSNDNLAEKKLFPPHQFRAASNNKKWRPYLIISMSVMTQVTM